MYPNVVNEDLRSIKTQRALYTAMFSLLKSVSFKKITVKGICEEALVCRAAFYAHFIDKYDLLKYCMTVLLSKGINENSTYEQLETTINYYVSENTKVIKNLFDDADTETFDLMFDFILSNVNLSLIKTESKDCYQKNVVLSSFYAGGILTYFSWLVKNKFPEDVPPMNRHFFKKLNEFQEAFGRPPKGDDNN